MGIAISKHKMDNQRKLNTYEPGCNISAVVHCGREYLTGILHAGHLQSTFYPAQQLHSYLQMRRNFFQRINNGRSVDSILTGGPDCHGIDTGRNIKKSGLSEEVYIDQGKKRNKNMLREAGINFTFYSPTHSEDNRKFVEDFFLTMLKSGYVIEKDVEGVYCPSCDFDIRRKDIGAPDKHKIDPSKKFSDDDEIEPRDFTPYKDIISDCYCKGESCGELTTGKLEYVTRKHYHLDLEALAPKILQFLEEVAVIDEFRNEQINNLRKMIEDEKDRHWDFTRNNNFGFDIPNTETGQKFFVWYDALLSYFSTIKSYFDSIGEPEKFKQFTQGENTLSFYHIGKGIAPHHLIYFSGMIITYKEGCSIEDRLNLPTDISIRHHLKVYERKKDGAIKTGKNGRSIKTKMSKSLDNTEGIDSLVSKYGSDMLSYYLTKSSSQSTKDPVFDEESLLEEAITFGHKIGNFVNRVKGNINKKSGGIILNYHANIEYREQTDQELDMEIITKNKSIFRSVGEHVERGDHKKALETILEFGDFLNKYYDARKPWSDELLQGERENIDYLAVASIKNLSLLLHFYTPKISHQIKDMLNQDYEFEWPDGGTINLDSGTKILDIGMLVDVKRYESMLKSLKLSRS